MSRWRVTYENVEWKVARQPFWKHEDVVDADSRKEAVEQVSANFPPPRYGNYRASKVKGAVENEKTDR